MAEETKEVRWYQVVLSDKVVYYIECTEVFPTERGHDFYSNETFIAFVPFSLAFFKIENPNDQPH